MITQKQAKMKVGDNFFSFFMMKLPSGTGKVGGDMGEREVSNVVLRLDMVLGRQ